MTGSGEYVGPEMDHIEVDANRTPTEVREVCGNPQSVIQSGWIDEVTTQVRPGQPDVETIEHLPVREPRVSEELGLAHFEETDIGTIEDDARIVDVRPTNVLVHVKWDLHRIDNVEDPTFRANTAVYR